ncbi:cytochrome o ubiquinol oxidase subunit IV [Pseudomonas sp. ABC1]|uniref:cytochrome o ubiquinol oxidase subunit IV n=1 Tax=Pseudomonas sp. ABC1 TaxID=2748080 RepID=UPI0015C3FD23|nr:cytochrome o ubiquinol oxidase subunit IV [Pseudomonas sp. ABC1]QLF93459.1 cytochrome o ubiquinol oxidase subunit IV [Pseudomonas sp. ABC1]
MAHEHTNSAGESHGSAKEYLTGFILSVILTVIPFALIMYPDLLNLSRGATLITVVLFGIVQILVHLVYFLHMSTDSEGRWNTISMLFTVLIIVLLVGLSIWVMWSMHYHMMIN